jgi:uncharacterized protein YpiB (UPF0302 family)
MVSKVIYVMISVICFAEEELLRELDEARDARRAAERQREELVKHAKQMQTKTQNKRNHGKFSQS